MKMKGEEIGGGVCLHEEGSPLQENSLACNQGKKNH